MTTSQSGFTAELRSPAPRRLIAAVALAVAGLCFAAGIGAGRSLAHVGGPGRLVSTRSYGGDLLVVFLALLVAGVGLLAYVLRPARRSRGGDQPRAVPEQDREGLWRAGLLVAAALVAVLGVAAAFLLLPHSHPTRPPLPPGAVHRPPGPIAPTTTGARATVPPVHWWGLGVVAAILVAGAAGAWVLTRRRPTAAADGAAAPEERLRRAVEQGLDDLDSEPDPRRAVIRAYGRMEAALAGHGLGRRPAETPLEYLARTLLAQRVSRGAVTSLTALHGRARFSQHDVDASMKREAIAALGRIRDELEDGR